MGKYAERMKSLLMDQIQKLKKQLDAYVRNPGHDFTRDRVYTFERSMGRS